jgi:SnoaL-like domain
MPPSTVAVRLHILSVFRAHRSDAGPRRYGDAVERARLSTWIDAYERAWRTPGTDWLAYLFTPDATYSMGPFEPTHEGVDAIANLWERERDGADEVFRMEHEVVAVDGSTGVVRVEVWYGDPVTRHYRDLWIVGLDDDGRCSSFEEWPFWPDKGPYAPDGSGSGT